MPRIIGYYPLHMQLTTDDNKQLARIRVDVPLKAGDVRQSSQKGVHVPPHVCMSPPRLEYAIQAFRHAFSTYPGPDDWGDDETGDDETGDTV
ncbi:hypothetical protein [Bifidobacterium tissieri]|uniref:Uncharacterized protein n=1 Tax=Bifidobacterium tissieri TaxID=1630162 RepID=A0A5M9ZVX3_9BIFI|nr:hypothetical protein [Bifidobacterium tissieri]KAA8828676.1 hypothetical protein EM849_11605 [Bifidobacterium tissieri]KAA8831619.1 hypothetical protein EMO89_02520 [Bifidobacterium tissieri]